MSEMRNSKQYDQYITSFKKYIQDLSEKDSVSAKKTARESLHKSGIINRNGAVKKNIVSR